MSSITVRCPHCGASMTVDEGMRDLLLAEGCVVCGLTLEGSDFAGTVPDS